MGFFSFTSSTWTKIPRRTHPATSDNSFRDLRACSRRRSIRTFVQPLRNNNLSVYVSRCKQSSNQSQPIVILMLVRLNGKSVYRSFLSLCHTHAHSFSFTSSIGPDEQFDTIQGQILYSLFLSLSLSFLFLHFSFQLSLFSRPAHIVRPAKNMHTESVSSFLCRICRNASVDHKCPRDERGYRKRDGDALGNVDVRVPTHEMMKTQRVCGTRHL